MKSTVKRILWVAGIVATVAVVGAVVGVVAGTKKNISNSTTTTSTTSNALTATGDGTAPTAIPSVTLDPALHKSFYGMAYTPTGAIMPDCGANITAVRKDMALLSQLTTQLRLYGSDCNVTSLVLQAIQDLNVDVKVFPAIFLEPDDASYTRQKTILQTSLSTYGTTNVLGVAVGNEYVLASTQAGDTLENATSRVVSKMNEVRTDLTALGYNLLVGTSDAGGMVSQTMVNAADFVFANVHPWFSQNTAAMGAAFANTFYTSTLVPLVTASTRTPAPVMYQGEYGWPSASDVAGYTNAGGDTPTIANLQTVLDGWVCPAKTAGTQYFWFEPFDEPWKATTGPVEAHWGLFDENRALKQITIPNCT